MKTRFFNKALLLLVAFVLAGCTASRVSETSGGKVKEENDQTVREFTPTAKTAKHELKSGLKIDAWTFNGSVPGPQLRVNQGDRLRITLKNNLPEPVSIHWHGMRVPNEMDGIPGVTQDAVQPGKSFVYDFVALDSGTYWYHSHQNGVEQVDKGLYGSIAVMPKVQTVKFDRDYTLVLDEWMAETSKGGGNNPQANMGGMSGMSGIGSAQGSNPEAAMMTMYNVFTINGKSAPAVPTLEVRKGERVKLRLVNAGYQTHLIHLHGHSFKVTETDGQPFKDPTVLKDTLVAVAPGERYDLEFTAENPGKWYLESHDEDPVAAGMKVEIAYADAMNAAADATPVGGALPVFDLTRYGSPGPNAYTASTMYDVTYTMELGARMAPGNAMKMEFTINGKAYPDTENVKVKKGDKVKVRFVNTSRFDHPMHLHGHFFQVLSRNGQPVSGTSVMKDTLNVRPGEEYEVAFLADAPGDWMFHCHDLHHASAGMVTRVIYDGFVRSFTPDPKAGNKPE